MQNCESSIYGNGPRDRAGNPKVPVIIETSIIEDPIIKEEKGENSRDSRGVRFECEHCGVAFLREWSLRTHQSYCP
jgi:hypothetical protein